MKTNDEHLERDSKEGDMLYVWGDLMYTVGIPADQIASYHKGMLILFVVGLVVSGIILGYSGFFCSW